MSEARFSPLVTSEPTADRRSGLLVLYVTAALILGFDQITKFWVRDVLAPGESLPFIGPLNLTHVTNTGAAFGILPNQTIFLAIVAVAVSLVIVFYGRTLKGPSPILRISLGLQLGGAIGNLIDRILLGHVTDFFDLRNGAGVNVWPVFNIADSAIVVGVATLAFYLLFLDRRRAPSPLPAESPAPTPLAYDDPATDGRN